MTTTTAATEHPPTFLRPALVGGAVLGFLFSLVALLHYPASPSQTLLYVIVLGLLALCAAVSVVGVRRGDRPGQGIIWRLSIIFGVLIGGLWIIEILTGNLIAVGSSAGIVVYRIATLTAFVLPLIAGAVGAYSGRRLRSGIAVGFWSGLISGLIAFLTLMGIAYAFMGTLQHDPQTLSEFAHSGERTLSTYIVGDFLAGSFSHLLLIGILYGTALAAVGAVLGKASASSSTTR